MSQGRRSPPVCTSPVSHRVTGSQYTPVLFGPGGSVPNLNLFSRVRTSVSVVFPVTPSSPRSGNPRVSQCNPRWVLSQCSWSERVNQSPVGVITPSTSSPCQLGSPVTSSLQYQSVPRGPVDPRVSDLRRGVVKSQRRAKDSEEGNVKTDVVDGTSVERDTDSNLERLQDSGRTFPVPGTG